MFRFLKKLNAKKTDTKTPHHPAENKTPESPARLPYPVHDYSLMERSYRRPLFQ